MLLAMTEGTPVRREYVNVKQAAALLGVSEMTIARWYDARRLNGFRTEGGFRRIWRDDKFLAELDAYEQGLRS